VAEKLHPSIFIEIGFYQAGGISISSMPAVGCSPTTTTMALIALIIAIIMGNAGWMHSASITVNNRAQPRIVAKFILFTALFAFVFAIFCGAIRATGTTAGCLAGSEFIANWC